MSKPPRQFTDEFKAEVVALCQVGDRGPSQVAQDLGLTRSTVQNWVKKANKNKETTLASATEKAELIRLRKENARLRMEREILKKAAAFFANEQA